MMFTLGDGGGWGVKSIDTLKQFFKNQHLSCFLDYFFFHVKISHLCFFYDCVQNMFLFLFLNKGTPTSKTTQIFLSSKSFQHKIDKWLMTSKSYVMNDKGEGKKPIQKGSTLSAVAQKVALMESLG